MVAVAAGAVSCVDRILGRYPPGAHSMRTGGGGIDTTGGGDSLEMGDTEGGIERDELLGGCSEKGDTVLHLACGNGEPHVVARLLGRFCLYACILLCVRFHCVCIYPCVRTHTHIYIYTYVHIYIYIYIYIFRVYRGSGSHQRA